MKQFEDGKGPRGVDLVVSDAVKNGPGFMGRQEGAGSCRAVGGSSRAVAGEVDGEVVK